MAKEVYVIKTKSVLIGETDDLKRAIQLAQQSHATDRKHQVGIYDKRNDCICKILESGSLLVKASAIPRVLLS